MPPSGSNLAYFTKNTTINGFNQKVQVDTGGNVKMKYVILDTNNKGSQLYQTYMVDLTSEVLQFAGKSINFPGGSSPSPDSSCWFEKNAVCTGGKMFCFGMRIYCEHGYSWVCMDVFYDMFFMIFVIYCIPQFSLATPSSYLFSSSGVEVTYIIVVFSVILILAVGGLSITLYVRYSLQIETDSTLHCPK